VALKSLLWFCDDLPVRTKTEKSMPSRYLLYYITDRTALAEDEPTRRQRLLEKIEEAAHAGVDYIQLREKDLSTRDLEALAREAVSIVRQVGKSTGNRRPETALLINSRTDVALAVSADGVHLRASDISPRDVRHVWQYTTHKSDEAQSRREPVIGVSCHAPAEVAQAATQGVTFAVFAPVFEKKIFGRQLSERAPQPAGLDALQQACRTAIPVLALGGVTLANALSCLDAGAAGISGIRLFQENNIGEIVRALRGQALAKSL
jgi:thiamine-phosphate pyrophosphorylase